MPEFFSIKTPNDRLTLFSRLLRWSLGGLFIWAGHHFGGAWPAYIFGGILVATGFFRPKRCLDEGCGIDPGTGKSS